ncbi:hypothetical protein X560_0306 [Listeria fleischmannii 1991]|uniref:Uncharacterized protein n=1 Tax=Listeria fleischmannii 1991 TaxID=1430899 RepID=A0A0J8J999_9LIST|nr:hypothetical protein X560_0306 [Listeria fleischmannii 1991]
MQENLRTGTIDKKMKTGDKMPIISFYFAKKGLLLALFMVH